MFKLCVILALSLASCYGAPEHGTVCGKIPNELNRCVVLPPGVSHAIQQKCKNLRKCERLTCTFREYNLLDGDVINKERTAAFFEKYAQEYSAFTAAIEHVKTDCLDPVKPLGVYLNCPVYDVIHCAYTKLIKHAAPSQWSTSPDCRRAREFAAACPICPDECFAPQVPDGSCDSCQSLSRQPTLQFI